MKLPSILKLPIVIFGVRTGNPATDWNPSETSKEDFNFFVESKDTSGTISHTRIIESGVLRKQEGKWKSLSGQISVITSD